MGGRIEQLISSLRGLRPTTAPITSIGQTLMGNVEGYNETLVDEQDEVIIAQRELQREAETARLVNELGGVIDDIGDAIIGNE